MVKHLVLLKIVVSLAVLAAATSQARPQTPPTRVPGNNDSIVKYLDQVSGLTADEAVAHALRNNQEIEAMRNEVRAAEALIRQARLRANPTLDVNGSRQMGGSDNSIMLQGALPLELGGRRASRIKVAESELEIRVNALAERERQLAFEVRRNFGEALASAYKLGFVDEILLRATQNLELVAAQVDEGRRPPLEKSVEIVELNHIRAMREGRIGSVELNLLDLRNKLGMLPEQQIKLRGDFDGLVGQLVSLQEATNRALATRPDIVGARAIERLAAARVDQARSEGRIDADLMLGYQRMKSGFPLLGIEESTGALLPIDSKFHFFTFGVKLTLPVRNRNQGMIEAAVAEESAARNRREFGELTIRREVASAFVKYQRSARAMEIYRLGVRDQAAANLDVIRQTYELGEKTLLDYIAEQRRFIETENGYIDSQLEAFLARLEVDRASNAAELVKK